MNTRRKQSRDRQGAGTSNARRCALLLTVLAIVLALTAPTGAQSVDLDVADAEWADSVRPPVIEAVQAEPIPLDQVQRLTPEEWQQVQDNKKKWNALHNAGRKRTVVDPDAAIDRAVPMTPEMPVPPDANEETGLRAPGDFVLYRDHTMTDAETNDQVTETTCEPSVGMNGRICLTTGNVYAGLGGDYAQNFNFVNPATNFPASAGGFCCDQVVQYDRTRGIMIWYLQYWGTAGPPSTADNLGRIAVSRGQQNQENNNWILYDITPDLFGYGTAVGFDFPDMALGANDLYLTTNITGHATDEAICIRLDLDDLANGNSVTAFNTISTLPNLRPTQGAGTTMFVGTQVDTDTLRIFRWPEADATATSVDRNVTAYFLGSTAPDPDGNDWIARDFNDILCAYISGPNMVFMWDSAAGGGFPMPNIRIARFRTSDRVLVDEGAIWSNSVAWAYPAVHPNDRGDVGGVFAFGGGGLWPSLSAVIADGFGGSQTGPFDGFTVANGNVGTANRWGDYYTARRNSPYGNTWVATGYVLRTEEPGARTRPHLVWFGREQDTPPANHTIIGDLANVGTWEDGTSVHPYNTVQEAHYAAIDGDALVLRAGTYFETLTLDKAVTVTAEGGTVQIR